MASNKSDQSKQKSAARKANQAARGSHKFKNGSNKHNGASRGQSGLKAGAETGLVSRVRAVFNACPATLSGPLLTIPFVPVFHGPTPRHNA